MIQKILFLIILPLTVFSYASDKLPAKSIFQLDHKWTTEKKQVVPLSSLRGHPTIVTMLFTSCPGACPLLVSDMKSFDQQLTAEEKKQVRYAAFSIDADRDNPDVLEAFFKKMSLNDRWTLFTSDKDQVRELAAALGFSYKPVGNEFTHSTSIFLLSADGEILSRKERSDDWKDFLAKFKTELKK